MKKIIDCRNITKSYGIGDMETQVLKGITFSVDEGEFVAIMGPSGSGKSTLMHILGALDTPTGGDYFLDGKNVANLSENELADIRMEKIGFVFQSFNLLPRTTVLRNVELPLIYAGVSKEMRTKTAEKALRDSAFPENAWLYHSNQISGGMMQRVAIARSLVNNPAMILADEPTGNLDSKTGEIVLHTFQSLNMEHGKTVVLITHEQYVAEHADRIIHILDGNILKDEKNHHKRIAGKEKAKRKKMKFSDLIEEVYNAVTVNKVRSGLTMLGIVIGIASVIAMVAIGQGTQATVQASIQSLGANLLMVTPLSQRAIGTTVSAGYRKRRNFDARRCDGAFLPAGRCGGCAGDIADDIKWFTKARIPIRRSWEPCRPICRSGMYRWTRVRSSPTPMFRARTASRSSGRMCCRRFLRPRRMRVPRPIWRSGR